MCRGTQKYEIVRRGWGTEIGDVNIWGGGGSLWDFEPSGQTLGMLILGGEVLCGDWERVRGFRDRYGGVLGKSLEILILEGVRGLGPEIENIDTGEVRVGEGLWTDTGNRVC